MLVYPAESPLSLLGHCCCSWLLGHLCGLVCEYNGPGPKSCVFINGATYFNKSLDHFTKKHMYKTE